ncbi:MAG: hypothetical protein ACYC2K_08190 [Gemmatimonadales bacterium]
MPTFLAPPTSIDVDDAGALVFEWYRDPRHVLEITVGETQHLIMAGIDGDDTVHVAPLLVDTLPRAVGSWLQRFNG